MRRATRLLAPALGAAALAAAFLLWSYNEDRPALPREANARGAVAIRWEPGARVAYDVTTEAVMRVRFPGAPQPVPVEARVCGALVLDVVGAEDGGVRGRFQLASVSYGPPGGPDRARELLLAAPFDVVFGADGQPARFEFRADVPEEGRVVLEQLIRTFQIVTTRDAGSRWTVREANGMGRYVADYRSMGDGTVIKRKMAFETVAAEMSGFPGPLEVRLLRSRATARLGSSWVEEVWLEEEMEVRAGGETVMTSRLMASLVRRATVPSTDEVVVPGSATTFRPADPAAELSRLLDGLDASEGASTSHVHGIRDLVVAHPGTAARVVAALADGSVGDPAAAALVNALELAGTPEAQAALGTVLEGAAYGRMNRLRAAIALAGVGTPTDVALDSLWRASERRASPEESEIADTALFALGALAPAACGTDDVETRLAGRLHATRDEDEKGILLGALGNTMNRLLAPTVMPYLDDASAYVRSSAADALGNMPGSATESRLVERLRVEGDPRVRTALVSSLNRMEEPSLASLEAVQALVLDEETASTRLEMAKLLGENLGTLPAARRTLERLLRQDRSARVRSYVGGVLLRIEHARRPS